MLRGDEKVGLFSLLAFLGSRDGLDGIRGPSSLTFGGRGGAEACSAPDVSEYPPSEIGARLPASPLYLLVTPGT